MHFTLDDLRWLKVPLNFGRAAYSRMIFEAVQLVDRKMAFLRSTRIRSERYRRARLNSNLPDCMLSDI